MSGETVPAETPEAPAPEADAFEMDLMPGRSADETLVVDVEGYEGPLDLLLALARAQKVDLVKISILALAEQYLIFVRQARRLRLELAADYLVMAAWLAFLKSRLLLPEEAEDDEPTGEELAARLAFRLQRLQAMREAAATQMARNLEGRDVFVRGAPEGIHVVSHSTFQASLYDLLSAYAARRTVNSARRLHVRTLPVWSVAEARERLERLVGALGDWQALNALLLDFLVDAALRPSVIASSFTATLELAREGRVEIRQARHFDPLYLRARPGRPTATDPREGRQ